jgi:hypothetical protein
LFLLQLGNVWAAYDKWYQYLQDRLEVDVESRMARRFLTEDLTRTSDVLVSSSSMVLSLDDSLPNRMATYRFQVPYLFRAGADPTVSFPVAAHVENAEFGLNSNLISSALLSFVRRDNACSMTIYMTRLQE